MVNDTASYEFWRDLAQNRALVLMADGSVRTLIGVHRHSGKVKVKANTHERMWADAVEAVSLTDGWHRFPLWEEATKVKTTTRPSSRRASLPWGPPALTADRLTLHPSMTEARHPRAPYILQQQA